MSVLIQISDTHFGTERAPVVEALLRFIHGAAPSLVVLSGDITQRARRSQFDAARAFADRLGPVPLLAIAGNHDLPLMNLPMRLLDPYRGFKRAFGPVLEPVHRSVDWLVVGVKTTRRWRHENGEVSKAQVERVAAQLARAAPEQMRLVVVHQPVAVPTEVDVQNLLRGHEGAVQRWVEAGADAILGGHIHLPYVLPLPSASGTAAPRRAWCVQAGTAVSARVRHEAGNSVNLLRHAAMGHGGARQAVVERWDYRAASDAFELAARHVLELSRGAEAG